MGQEEAAGGEQLAAASRPPPEERLRQPVPVDVRPRAHLSAFARRSRPLVTSFSFRNVTECNARNDKERRRGCLAGPRVGSPKLFLRLPVHIHFKFNLVRRSRPLPRARSFTICRRCVGTHLELSQRILYSVLCLSNKTTLYTENTV